MSVLETGKPIISFIHSTGKSTVAALLERFYEPDEGVVSLDSVPVRELNPSWLRGKVIGYISQEPVLFATSIMENIRFGRPTASDEEVWEAARLANCDQFVREFPQGYETQLGERGQTLSGGQKQRWGKWVWLILYMYIYFLIP